MVAPLFIEFVRKQRAANISVADITRTLATNGLSGEEIAQAFAEAGMADSDSAHQGEVETASTPAPAPPVVAAAAPTAPPMGVVAPASMPTASQSALIKTSVPARPRSVLYFEVLLFLSIVLSVTASAMDVSGWWGGVSVAVGFGLLLLPLGGAAIKALLVMAAAHWRANWARILLLVFVVAKVVTSASFIFLLMGGMGVISLIQVALVLGALVADIAAMVFAFSRASNEWFSAQSGGAIAAELGTKSNRIWAVEIPRMNRYSMIASMPFVFGLDLAILIMEPDLAEYWYMMLVVLAVFSIFYYIENFVLSRRLASRSHSADGVLYVFIVLRNIAFILNFVPGIQLLGLAALFYAGVPFVILYGILLYLILRA